MAYPKIVSVRAITFCEGMSLELDDERARATVRVNGRMEMASVDALFRVVNTESSEWFVGKGNGGYDCLIDFTEATFNFRVSEISDVVRMNAEIPTERREAVVAPRDLMFGLSRIYQALQPARCIKVFRDKETAEVWLDEPA